MDKLRSSCLELFKSNEINKYVIKPIISHLYNEIYIYIWLICIYHIFFIFIILAIFYILIKILNNTKTNNLDIFA
jgi:hypothetical protein